MWECLPAPGTKVNASVTLLHHVIAETETYGRPVCTRFSVSGSGTAVNAAAKSKREGGNC